MKQNSEILETKLFSRSFDLQRDSLQEESRTLDIAFSSEEPVESISDQKSLTTSLSQFALAG